MIVIILMGIFIWNDNPVGGEFDAEIPPSDDTIQDMQPFDNPPDPLDTFIEDESDSWSQE